MKNKERCPENTYPNKIKYNFINYKLKNKTEKVIICYLLSTFHLQNSNITVSSMCVYVRYMGTHMWTHECRELWSTLYVSINCPPLTFDPESFTQPRAHISNLSCQHPRYSPIYLTTAGSIGTYCSTWLFTWLLEIWVQVPILRDKRFIIWSISLA